MAEAYVKSVKVEVRRGSLLELEVDAIVNPANSMLTMWGGVAGAIKRIGGEEIEAVKNAPLPVGRAIVTSAGKLKARHVIHAPTMEEPDPTTTEKVYKAMYAALELACNMNFRSMAIPGMGTGVGGLSPDEATKAMFKVLKDWLNRGLTVKHIIFIDLKRKLSMLLRSNLIDLQGNRYLTSSFTF